MNDELVKRLRAATFSKGRTRGGITGQTIEAQMRATYHEVSEWDLDEAADRIEALEAALLAAEELAKILDTPDQSDGEHGRYHYEWPRVDDALAAYYAAVEGKA